MIYHNSKYQILILGGTGAMGISLVAILSQRENYNVFVTSRKSHENKKNVEYFLGNAHDTEWLKEILLGQNWDAIVDFMAYTTEEFSQRVELLLESTKQYIFKSSARVYADSGNAPLTEGSPRLLDVCTDEKYLKTDEYALTKARQENCLMESKRKNWSIVRPYITFSETRLQLGVMEKENWLIPALNNRPIVFSSDIANHYTTMTSGYTVAQCIASLIMHPESYGEVFHIASSEYHKWNEIFQWYVEVYQKTKKQPPQTYYTDIWNSTFGGSEYQWKYDRLFDRRFDNSKIKRLVPKDVFVPMEKTLKSAIELFIKTYNPNIKDLNQDVELYRGILTGCFLPIYKVKGFRRKVKVIACKYHLYKILKINF